MRLEDEIDPENPQVLYDRLPFAEPHADGTFLRLALPEEIVVPTKTPGGIFKMLDVDSFMEMPLFLGSRCSLCLQKVDLCSHIEA